LPERDARLLDITASVELGGKASEVIVDEDGYVELLAFLKLLCARTLSGLITMPLGTRRHRRPCGRCRPGLQADDLRLQNRRRRPGHPA
jgi:hypothetical protein